MAHLKRKTDIFLETWKSDKDRKPLIIKGARQVGKTETVREFAKKHYKSVIEINFALQKQYKDIFNDGFEVDTVIKNITLHDPSLKVIPNETLIFFDEMQDCVNCATSLKSFNQDRRYDVICSGSLMGINYGEIESNSVGNKEDYEMYSMDFEEFLWAKGYLPEQIEEYYRHLIEVKPLSDTEYNVMLANFREYIVIGGMPAIVSRFVTNKNYSGTLQIITKYAHGLDKGKILNIYRKTPVFLGKENKKFQISKVSKNARNRDYIGTVEWLDNAGIINICYCMELLELPLKGNYNPNYYKLYFRDTGLLVGSLEDEVQKDLRDNKNFNTYKGALYESIVADMLVKQGYQLYFYKNEKSTVEMDFFVRDSNSLIPVEVKANDSATASLNKLIQSDKFSDIKYGIKLANKNIGWNGRFYTMPYFLTFLLKRFLSEVNMDDLGSPDDLKAIAQAHEDLINYETINHSDIDWN